MSMSEVKNHNCQLYIKQSLRSVLRTNPVTAISLGDAVVMFSNDVSLDVVSKSLEVILMDIRLRMEDEKDN